MTCPDCRHCSNNYEVFTDLSVDMLQGVNTLEGLMAGFLKSELLDHENLWHCSGCKKGVRAKKSVSIFKVLNVFGAARRGVHSGNVASHPRSLFFFLVVVAGASLVSDFCSRTYRPPEVASVKSRASSSPLVTHLLSHTSGPATLLPARTIPARTAAERAGGSPQEIRLWPARVDED